MGSRCAPRYNHKVRNANSSKFPICYPGIKKKHRRLRCYLKIKNAKENHHILSPPRLSICNSAVRKTPRKGGYKIIWIFFLRRKKRREHLTRLAKYSLIVVALKNLQNNMTKKITQDKTKVEKKEAGEAGPITILVNLTYWSHRK